jgi:hypothetical protein
MTLFGLIFFMFFQGATVSLRGVVVNALTNEPIRNATVELRNVERPEVLPRLVQTGNDGSFIVSQIARGRYHLTVSRVGHLRATYGERRPGGVGSPINLVNDTTIKMELRPAAVVTGRVLGRNGQPLGNATVEALRVSFAQGQKSLTTVQSTLTNDLGEYRLFSLLPGQYFISAFPGPRGIGGPTAGEAIREFRMERDSSRTQQTPSSKELDVPIYFPGTNDWQTASPVNLNAGTEVRNIDFIAAPVAAYQIRGTAIGEGGQEVSGPVTLRTVSPSRMRVTSSPTLEFSVSGMLPARYVVVATVGRMTGKITVDVIDRDVENLRVPVSNPVTVSGHIQVDHATTETPGPNLRNVRILLRSDPADGGVIPPATIGADNTFTFPSVPTGTYRVSLLPPLQTGYIKSVQWGTSDGRDTITVRDARDTLQIVIEANGAAVLGSVVNDRGEPEANVMVVLVPAREFRARSDLFRSTLTSQTGEFKLEGIAPGDYKVFAWHEVEGQAWLTNEFLAPYEDQGISISLTEGSRQTLKISRALD